MRIFDTLDAEVTLTFGHGRNRNVRVAAQPIHVSDTVVDRELGVVVVREVKIVWSDRLLHGDYVRLFQIPCDLLRARYDGIDNLLTRVRRELIVVLSKNLL